MNRENRKIKHWAINGLHMFFLFSIFFVISACSYVRKTNEPQMSLPSNVEIEILQELSEKNTEWLSAGKWVHYQAIPSDTGTIHLTTHDRWTLVDNDGYIQQDFYRIYQFLGTEEVQKFITNNEGLHGELYELRRSGLNALDYAVPTKVDSIFVDEISMVTNDIEYLEYVDPVISDFSIVENESEGRQVIVVTIEITDHLQERMASVPAGKLGKREEFTYDMETGQRIKYARSFLDANNTWEIASYVEEDIQFADELPEEVLVEFQESEKELDFYNALYNE